jgi:NitT/TauT family transport system substrate-binding protein
VVALKSSGITKPADLRGKKIGVYSLSSGTRQNLQVLLHQVGLSESDVTVQVTGLLTSRR